jgi:transaldolase
MDAYTTGLEQRHADGQPVSGVDSVASFFVSRVDSEVDGRIDLIVKESGDDARIQTAGKLRGEAAIANARLAFQAFEQFSATERWQALKALGASPQRPLWASTGVKDPAYDDTRYVAELVAPGTVNTIPEATLDAFADHGVVRGATAAQGYDQARSVFDQLESIGIGYDRRRRDAGARGPAEVRGQLEAAAGRRAARARPPRREHQQGQGQDSGERPADR